MEQKTIGILVIILCVAAFTLYSADNQKISDRSLYQQWKKSHFSSIQLTPEQDEYRFRVFQKNLQEINEHNAKPDETYKAGVNQFTGLSRE